MLLTIKIIEKDDFNDLDIYSQGAQDWSRRSWVEFTWGWNKQCPDGFEAINNIWTGTMQGFLSNGQVSNGTNYNNAQEIPVQDAVNQTQIYGDMTDILCGRRGDYSYRNYTRGYVDP